MKRLYSRTCILYCKLIAQKDTFSLYTSCKQRICSVYAPNFEKVGDILVSACPYVCMYVCVCVYVFMFEISS